MFWSDPYAAQYAAAPLRPPTPTYSYGYYEAQPQPYPAPVFEYDHAPVPYEPYPSARVHGSFDPFYRHPSPAFPHSARAYTPEPERPYTSRRPSYTPLPIEPEPFSDPEPPRPPPSLSGRRSRAARPPRFSSGGSDWDSASEAPSAASTYRRRTPRRDGNSLSYKKLHPRSSYRHPTDLETASVVGGGDYSAARRPSITRTPPRLSASLLQQASRQAPDVQKPLYDPHDNDAASQISRGTVKTTTTWRPPAYDADGKPIKITRAMKRKMSLGVRNGKLASIHPRSRPRAVSSQVPLSDQAHRVEPLALTVDVEEAIKRLKKAVKRVPNANLVREDADYLHYEVPSGGLIFVIDDLEFYVDKEDQKIHVRSAARLGPDDKGRNRMRVNKIWTMYLQSLERLPPSQAYHYWRPE